jgi:nickel/cobalt exporter
MDLSGSGVLILAAILSGVVHAFDVDHLVTVATFSSTGGGRKNSIRFCAHWAIGHGATILALAILVYFTGIKLPAGFFEAAEALVGLVLIGLGVWVFRGIHQYLTTGQVPVRQHVDLKRKPFAIGTLHGVAGSAPILLAFLVDVHTPLLGLGLILLFVAGVFVSMIGVGLILGPTFKRVSRVGEHSIEIARGVLASLSIIVGGTLVYGYL